MGDTGIEKQMSIAEQALFLLDIETSEKSRRQLDCFKNIDSFILQSFSGETEPVAPASIAPADTMNAFSVASRLSRSNYEDQARAEALTNALRKIRNRNPNASFSKRVIRNT